MAYITPNSTIKLFSGVPLDNSYRNTLYFANENQQLQYFASTGAGLVATLNNQMYQRVSQGVCKVEVPFGTAYAVNYMAFKNTDFENKWFYAFVNDVKYINNGVCEIDYELDVMQTFMFDVDLQPCLVEREHINKASDTIGANILPEQFDVGEYKISGLDALMGGLSGASTCWIILGMVSDKLSDYVAQQKTIYDVGIYDATVPEAEAGFHDGVYSGLKYYAFDGTPTGAAELTTFINNHIKTVDNIYSLYMAPKALLPTVPGTAVSANGYEIDNLEFTDMMPSAAPAVSAYPDFDGYTPANNKLYTYPYNFCGITNGQGNGLILRYEFFEDHTPRFIGTGTFVDPVTITVRPYRYKGAGTSFPDMGESISITGFPQCSWSYDTYSRWVAAQLPQEKRAMTRHLITSGIGIAAAGAAMVATGGLAGIAGAAVGGAAILKGANLGTNLLNKTATLYEKRYEASIAQDPLKGNSASGNSDFAAGLLNFYRYRGHITGEVAKEIDHYFSVFGYQTNEVKVPNRTGRTIWNYVKTANCTLTKRAAGKVTAADISQMEGIYDNGITFWHQPDQVGNYSDANMRAN